MLTLFKLRGLHSPGRVNLYRYGTLNLEDISDELAEKIWKDGCPYLELTPEGRKKFYPNEKPISVKPIAETVPVKKKPDKK